jgi:membrane-associated phospholipid phosphatase
MKKLQSDFKKLFVDWQEYYSLPLYWDIRRWFFFVCLISIVIISAYFDEPIRYCFFEVHNKFVDKVAGFVHWFGTGYPTLYIFLALYICGMVFRSDRLRLSGLMLLQTYLYSGAITIALKSLVGRWRPYASHGHLTFTPLVTGPNAHLSFPSGDVAVVFSLAIVLCGVVRFKENSPTVQRALVYSWRILWITIAVLTSLSRIYFDQHWFSDVVFSVVNAVAAGSWVVKRHRTKA